MKSNLWAAFGILSLSAIMALSPLSAKADLYGKTRGETLFIKVTPSQNQTFTYEVCELAQPNNCRILGGSPVTEDKIKAAGRGLRSRGTLKAAGSAAVVVIAVPLTLLYLGPAAALGAGSVATWIGLSATGAMQVSLVAGIGATAASGAGVAHVINRRINPLHNFKANAQFERGDEDGKTSMKIKDIARVIDIALRKASVAR